MTRRFTTAFLLLAMLGAACGGEDTTSEPTPTDDATTPAEVATTPATQEPTAADTQPTTGATGTGEVVTITTVNYAFEGVPEQVAPGTELQITNASTDEVHELVALRIDDDETRPLEELLGLEEAEQEQIIEFTGVAVAFPGEAGFAPEGPVVLTEPGRYALLCFIPTGADPEAYRAAVQEGGEGPPDVEGGPPHIANGMVAELIVG